MTASQNQDAPYCFADKTYRVYAPDQPFVFTHIPKCAGTSFIRVLRFWFREAYCHLIQDESRDIKLPKVGVLLEKY